MHINKHTHARTETQTHTHTITHIRMHACSVPYGSSPIFAPKTVAALFVLWSSASLQLLLLQRQTLFPGQLIPLLVCQTLADPLPVTAFMLKYTVTGESQMLFLLLLQLPPLLLCNFGCRKLFSEPYTHAYRYIQNDKDPTPVEQPHEINNTNKTLSISINQHI